MAFRRRLKNKRPPEGWELIEEVIEDFENQMKEAVNEEHEGKRRAELTYKITRIHWEKNRFIYDLMYQRKVMSRDLFDYLVREKIADGALVSKWRKPGYEILCSMLAIQKGNHNFGTTSHCRVPLRKRAPQQRITPDIQTGCVSCASGDGRFGGPIWWNTPLEDEATEEDNRALWTQGETNPSNEDEASHKDKKARVGNTQGNEEEEEEEAKEAVNVDEEEEGEEQVDVTELSRPVPQPVDDNEIPREVRDRLAALKKELGHHAD